MTVAIFGYGSLIDPESLAKTIGRLLPENEFVPAVLTGYARVWNFRAQVFSLALNRNIQAVFLNVVAAATAEANGVVFRVSAAELELLKKREKNYAFRDITPNLRGFSGEPTFTFTCDHPEFLAGPETAAQPDFFVMKKYLALVDAACRKRGENFFAEFNRSTGPNPFPQLEGEYRFP